MSSENSNTKLSLPKSLIKVTDSEFLRMSCNEEVIAKHPLATIKEVSSKRIFDPASIAFFLMGAALAYFPYHFIDQPIVKWVLVVAGIIAMVLSVLGCIGERLNVTLKSGETLTYTINDLPEEARGFAHTLAAMLKATERGEVAKDDFESTESDVQQGEEEFSPTTMPI